MDINEVWDKALISIKKNISSAVSYNVHIKAATPVSFDNSFFIISVPTSINKNIIDHLHKSVIEASLEKVTGSKLTLKIFIEGENTHENSENSGFSDIYDLDWDNITLDDDIPLDAPIPIGGINPKYTFDNFIVGDSNQFASAAAKSVSEAPGVIYNPLFIYGNSGLGKTHLMQAIGNKTKELHNNLNILYVTGEKFTSEFITSVRENTKDEFTKKYRSLDVLLVDDVQFFEGKEETQKEFFHTFNELFDNNKQIVLTSDRKPGDLTTLTSRLRTRFGQGLTIDVSVPNFETRVAILQEKALSYNTKIDIEILEYIAENIRSSVRELEGALTNITSMSDITGAPITMETVKKMLEPIISGNSIYNITPDRIVQRVAFYFNITESDIMGKIKTKNIAVPRQIAMYLCRKMLSLSDTEISRIFGKDRTTVNSNISKIEEQLNSDNKLNTDIAYITKDIEAR